MDRRLGVEARQCHGTALEHLPLGDLRFQFAQLLPLFSGPAPGVRGAPGSAIKAYLIAAVIGLIFWAVLYFIWRSL